MSGSSYGEALRQAHVLLEGGAIGGLTDRELLARYAARPGDAAESAFAAIVTRHGPMVLRACSALIGDEHEAHDAFQATFLILARKASTLRVGESLGPWLHEVARRVSSCARSASARRGRLERRAAVRSPRFATEPEIDDCAPALHEEVDRLPERYRMPIVLCDLEGLTQEQAASRLGWPLGTVRSRLARGRDRLRGRLTRRGLAPAAVLPIPPALSDAAVEAAARLAVGGPVPLTTRLLTEGGLRTMRMIRWKTAAALTLAIGLAASGAGLLARRSLGDSPKTRAKAEDRAGAPQEARAAVEDFPGEDQVIVRVAPSRTKVWAFSPATHAWRTYRLPEGVKVVAEDDLVQLELTGMQFRSWVANPGGEVIAPPLRGDEIAEIAAFDVPKGEWVRQALREPAHQSCMAYTGKRFAIYRAGRYLYGFSAATSRWAVLDLGEDVDKDKHVGESKEGITHFNGVVAPDGRVLLHRAGDLCPIDVSGGGAKNQQPMGIVRVGRLVCGFSVPTGTWDILDLGADNTNHYPFSKTPIFDATILVPRGDHLYHFNAAKGRFQDIESEEAGPGR